jgi:hypothetical protein
MSVVTEREREDEVDENTSRLKKAKESDACFRFVAEVLLEESKRTGQYDDDAITQKWIDVVTNKNGEGLSWQNLHAQLKVTLEIGSGEIQAQSNFSTGQVQIEFYATAPIVRDVFVGRINEALFRLKSQKNLPVIHVLTSQGVSIAFPLNVKRTDAIVCKFLNEFFACLKELKISIRGF